MPPRKNFLAKSPQEESRKISMELIRKNLPMEEVMTTAEISQATYYRHRNICKERKTHKRKPGSGRPPRLTKANKLRIHRFLGNNPFLSTRELSDMINGEPSHQTIDRYLRYKGFVQKNTSSHFKLSEDDIAERLSFANSLSNYNRWGLTIFLDETTIWLHDEGMKGWFHKDQENSLSREKNSGKVNICATISTRGKVFLTTFRDNLDSRLFSEILKEDLLPNANLLYPRSWTLAEDNSTSHQGEAKPILKALRPRPLKWPSRSPDLNPIENFWALLKRSVKRRFPQDLDELEECIFDEWDNMPNNVVENLCNFFPDRIRKVKISRGKKIKY